MASLGRSAFQGIVNAVTGVIGKLSSDQATEFAAAAGAEQAVLIARMQADSQAYQARIALYRGMFWLQFALLTAYIGPLSDSLLVYLDSSPFLRRHRLRTQPTCANHESHFDFCVCARRRTRLPRLRAAATRAPQVGTKGWTLLGSNKRIRKRRPRERTPVRAPKAVYSP
jgi:hypothetical protein